MPGERQRQCIENLLAVAGQHSRWAALGLPTTEEELRENFSDLVRYMPQSQDAEAWERYFGTGDTAYTSSSSGFNFNEINRMLRTGRLPDTRLEGCRSAIVKLAMGMELLPAGTALYRGISLHHVPALRRLCEYLDARGVDALRRYTGTKEFRDDGFVSTSRAELGAGRFVNDKADSVLLVVTTGAGVRGREPRSEHRGERETTLAPGTRFTVTSAAKGRVVGGGNKIYYRFAVTARFG